MTPVHIRLKYQQQIRAMHIRTKTLKKNKAFPLKNLPANIAQSLSQCLVVRKYDIKIKLT